ncbi:MAG: RnfABCDGE type electron transport complex subunit D, partial [Oscillospiraceae bacterium]|nr:RnfABCDGE type electron transport complex subunit D [Oscillospiraceae bacterium]
LIGKFSGPMGTGFVLLLIVAAVFLMMRQSISAIIFFAEFLSAGIIALIHYGFDPMALMCFFSGGMFLFGMIFLSCDHSTMPKTISSRLVYGIVVGCLTALFQFYAAAENAVVYAVILAAPVGIELNRRTLSFAWVLNKSGGIFSKISKFSKPIKHVAETIDLLNEDKNDDEKK